MRWSMMSPASGRGHQACYRPNHSVAGGRRSAWATCRCSTRATGPAGAGFVGGDFHSLVDDPTTSGRIFVEGHEAASASADGGRTWRRVDSLDGADAMGWGFYDCAVYVSGHRGISRSTDGGVRFQKASAGLPDTHIHAFGASASTLYRAGPATGVMASTGGGRTWRARTTTHGQPFFGRILTDPGDDEHLIAADARPEWSSAATEGRAGADSAGR